MDGVKGKDDSISLFSVVVWSDLVNYEFSGQLEKSTPPPLFPRSWRGTEACRAAAGGHGLTTGFVTSISSYSFSYFIQFCNASLGILVMIEVVDKVMDVIE